jgi:hypothetical protein
MRPSALLVYAAFRLCEAQTSCICVLKLLVHAALRRADTVEPQPKRRASCGVVSVIARLKAAWTVLRSFTPLSPPPPPLCSSQAWFMEGKEGKEYKPNSLHQIMRRLGFFPTMRSSRAGNLSPPPSPHASNASDSLRRAPFHALFSLFRLDNHLCLFLLYFGRVSGP